MATFFRLEGKLVTIVKMKSDFNDQMFDLAAYAFAREKSATKVERFEYLARNSKNYGSLAEKKLVSQIMATPFLVNFWNQTFEMRGIGYVSSYPEFRKQGRIDKLMKQVLEDSYDEGVQLAYLAPFSYPFYRRYGYETAFLQIRYEAPAEKWPFGGQSHGKVSRVSFEVAQKNMVEIYQKSTESMRGGMLRAEWWFTYKFSLHKNFNFALYEENGVMCGYVVYQISVDKLEIIELVALSEKGKRSLHDFIAAHSGTVKTIHWTHPFGGTTKLLQVLDPQVEVKILPYMMARVVNVATFLKSFPWQEKILSDFAIEIYQDNYLPANNGIYEIYPDGNVSKVKESLLPKIKATPQSFTQLFLGSVKIKSLQAEEKIDVTPELAYTLEKLLPSEKPLLADYF